MNLFFVTPSYIYNESRLLFAKKSFDSLNCAIGELYPHIVMDDEPYATGMISKYFPNKKWDKKASELYNKKNIIYIRRKDKKGSASATYDGVLEAKKRGANLIFINSDDLIYKPIIKNLIQFGIDAISKDKNLMVVKFSAFPIVGKYCDQRGNMSCLEIKNEKIVFEDVCLTPTKYPDYTLWSSYFNEKSINGRFWPVALWLSIFRVEFLEKVFTFDKAKKITDLGHMEQFYKNKDNWELFLKEIKGYKFGYINMQFGGFEFHRTPNWEEIINRPNKEIR